MPNCFFVISGRSRLQWADLALHGQLDHTGPAAWPGLATVPGPGPVPPPRHGTPGGRQHLVGDLSPKTATAISPAAWSRTAGPSSALDTPADALAELLTAITRRQHEHRWRTADRLTAVLDTGLLPAELTEMALYYRANESVEPMSRRMYDAIAPVVDRIQKNVPPAEVPVATVDDAVAPAGPETSPTASASA